MLQIKQITIFRLKTTFLYLFHFVILSEQSVRTVGDTHADDAHAADHYHGNIHIREDRHYSSSYEEKKKEKIY